MQDPLIAVYDEDCRLTDLSPAVAESFDLILEEIIGQRPPFPWWPESDADALRKLLEWVVTEEARPYEGIEIVLSFRMPAGGVAPFRCSLQKRTNGDTAVLASPVEYAPAPDLIRRAIDLLNQCLPHVPESAASQSLEPQNQDLLSERERTVLRMLATGQRVKEVASALHISIHTVRNHRKAIFRKLDVSSQIELMSKLAR